MIATISPSTISGEVYAPASKSAMQRACALALMNNGRTIILNPGRSNDDKAAQEIIRHCGASLTYEGEKLIIDSVGKINPSENIHCGESGLSIRMFTPIVALSDKAISLTGEGSLLTRPMHIFEEVLPRLGVSVRTRGGFLPISVRGPLVAQDSSMDGSKSSQYVTGILFALAKAAKKRLTLTVSNLTSRPYIDLSMQMLQHFGYKVDHSDYKNFVLEPVENVKRDILYTVEGDWSGAAFLLVAGVIAGQGVFIKSIDKNSKQADRAIIDVLQMCGASVEFSNDGFAVGYSKELKAFEFDATQCPDLFPPLVALAVCCKGESIIHGTSRLLTKESDRLAALIDVFTKMGASITAAGDSMMISGKHGLTGAKVDGHHDHRIVMACAVAALRAKGDVLITGVEAINKSYPDFFNHLKLLGAGVSLSDNNDYE